MSLVRGMKMRLNSSVGRYSLVVKRRDLDLGEVWIFQTHHGDCVEWPASSGEPSEVDLDTKRGK